MMKTTPPMISEDRGRCLCLDAKIEKVRIEKPNVPEQLSSTIRVYDARDVIDNQIEPLVNRRVSIDGIRQQDSRYYYRDIQAEE